MYVYNFGINIFSAFKVNHIGNSNFRSIIFVKYIIIVPYLFYFASSLLVIKQKKSTKQFYSINGFLRLVNYEKII